MNVGQRMSHGLPGQRRQLPGQLRGLLGQRRGLLSQRTELLGQRRLLHAFAAALLAVTIVFGPVWLLPNARAASQRASPATASSRCRKRDATAGAPPTFAE